MDNTSIDSIPIELLDMIFDYMGDYLSILNLVCVGWHKLASRSRHLVLSGHAAHCAVKNYHPNLLEWVIKRVALLPGDLHLTAIQYGDMDTFERLLFMQSYRTEQDHVELALIYGNVDMAETLAECSKDPFWISETCTEELAELNRMEELGWVVDYYLTKGLLIPDVWDLTRCIVMGAVKGRKLPPLDLVEKELIPLLSKEDLTQVLNLVIYYMDSDFGMEWINHIAAVRQLQD